MQAISKKVSNKYKSVFKQHYGSIKEFAAWSGLHYHTARCFRSQYVIDKADEFLKIIKENERKQLSKSI